MNVFSSLNQGRERAGEAQCPRQRTLKPIQKTPRGSGRSAPSRQSWHRPSPCTHGTWQLQHHPWRCRGWQCQLRGHAGAVPLPHRPATPTNSRPTAASALRGTESAHRITFSSCSLVSSSIFLRYMAPLTVSSLEGRGALGTGGPTAARGAAVPSGRGRTWDRADPVCRHLSSTADSSNSGVGARGANTVRARDTHVTDLCVWGSVGLLDSTRRFPGFQWDRLLKYKHSGGQVPTLNSSLKTLSSLLFACD